MPNLRDTGGRVDEVFANELGHPTAPPAPPTAVPTSGGAAPIVSSTPGPGQIPALDAAGNLNAIVGQLAVLTSDPTSPKVGAFWYRSDTSQFCVRHDTGTTKRVTLS